MAGFLLLLVFSLYFCDLHAQVAPPPLNPSHPSTPHPPLTPQEEEAIHNMVSPSHLPDTDEAAFPFGTPLFNSCASSSSPHHPLCCAVSLCWQLNEDTPSVLWYSSTGADGASLTGLGAGQVPAHYHHMYYHGPAPHQHHASSYDEFATPYPPSSPSSHSTPPPSPHFDEAEADPHAARHHSEGHLPVHHPPAAYHYHSPGEMGGPADDGWIHEVPRWMEKQGKEGWEEAERMMAGNTAQQKLRRQQKRAAEEAEKLQREEGKSPSAV